MRFEELTENSRKMYEEGRKYIPGGVSYSIRDFYPYPFYAKKAKGAYVLDLDGNKYIDLWMEHGAAVLGHNDKRIIEAVKEQLEEGVHFGWANEWEVKWAKAVLEWFCMDKVRPTNSGTEANMYAIRLARAFTGRKKIVKVVGGWHGGYDALMKGVHYPPNSRESLGLLEEILEHTLLIQYNNLMDARKIIKEEKPAAVIVEPVLGAGGCIPAEKEFLETLRELCNEYGALLIFDEVITGFRFFRGATNYYGIKPDIITCGKAVGGQYFPGAGAICGTEEVMEFLDHRKRKKFGERVFHGGTYVGNAISMRAGYELIKILRDNHKEIYRRLEDLGKKLKEGLEEVFVNHNINAFTTGIGSMVGLHFTKVRPKNYEASEETKDVQLTREFFSHMLSAKVAYLTPEKAHFFLSYAHSDEDIEYVIYKAEEFAKMKGRD